MEDLVFAHDLTKADRLVLENLAADIQDSLPGSVQKQSNGGNSYARRQSNGRTMTIDNVSNGAGGNGRQIISFFRHSTQENF